LSFDEYIAHGWRLCLIQPGGKAPLDKGWNARGAPQPTIPPGYGAGLMHVESGTCALDIDMLTVADAWLTARGMDLDSLLTAPTAVRISSGRTGRAKLLYRLPHPLQSKKTAPFQQVSPKTGKIETYTALDFRCATRDGLSMQDVLPPTIHPDTGKPYVWQYGDDLTGSWRNLPMLPPELLAIWQSLLVAPEVEQPADAPKGAAPDELRALLDHFDPNDAYNEWLEVGMALHWETRASRDGLLLWNEWSCKASGPNKYQGMADLEPHWRSFRLDTPNPITLGSLLARRKALASDFPLVPVSTTAPVQSNGRRKFQKLNFEDFINGEPPEWIVDGVLPKATIGALYGASGSGKSFLGTDLGLHIAEGRPWRGRAVKQLCVVYLIAEGVAGGRLRLRTARDELHFNAAGFSIIEDTPNLLDKTDPPILARELVEGERPGLVIVDTLAQTTPGADENSAKDMSVALEHCKLIHLATGAMVLLIAHAGKDETRGMRGWSGIKAAMDVEIECTDTQPNTPGSLRVAKITKLKDGEEGLSFPFRLRGVGKSCVVEHTDEQPQKGRAKKLSTIAAILHSVLTDKLGIGGGVSARIEDVIEDALPQTGAEAGRENEMRSKLRNTLRDFTGPNAGFLFEGALIKKRGGSVADFALHPVSGIDPAPAQADNSDLL
jgi:hypothetical protein